MDRRGFITAAAAATVWSTVGFAAESASPPKERSRNLKIVAAIQRHFFPKGLQMPDADAFNAASYLEEAVTHDSFDPDIRTLIFEGASRFESFCDGRFVSADAKERERMLREFEKSDFGSYWLAQIMNLTLEALLCDPIYGGNVNKRGWRAFGLTPGRPRPKERYCGV